MADKYKLNPITGKLDMVGEGAPAVVTKPTMRVTPNIAGGTYEDGRELNVTFSIVPTKGTYALDKITISGVTTPISNPTSGQTYTHTAKITKATTIKFTLTDTKGNAVEVTVAYDFGNMRYIGFANPPAEGPITESWLDNNFSTANKSISTSYKIGEKKYTNSRCERFYVIVPASTKCTSDNIKTLEGGEYRAGMMEDNPTEVTITTSQNKEVSYLVFRSDHKLTTAKDVTVKVE